MIYLLSFLSSIIASLHVVSKGLDIFWFEINGANIFWIFFICKIGFFPVLQYHHTAKQVCFCSRSVIPVPRQVIRSQLQPFLYAWNISAENLQLRSNNQHISWMLKCLSGMKRQRMWLFWFRNLLYLDSLCTLLQKFCVPSCFHLDQVRIFGTAFVKTTPNVKEKEQTSSVNELLLGSRQMQ